MLKHALISGAVGASLPLLAGAAIPLNAGSFMKYGTAGTAISDQVLDNVNGNSITL